VITADAKQRLWSKQVARRTALSCPNKLSCDDKPSKQVDPEMGETPAQGPTTSLPVDIISPPNC
jgi:hypothetical protein